MSKNIRAGSFVAGSQLIPLETITGVEVVWAMSLTQLYFSSIACIACLLAFIVWGSDWLFYATILTISLVYFLATKLEVKTFSRQYPLISLRGGISNNFTKRRQIIRAISQSARQAVLR